VTTGHRCARVDPSICAGTSHGPDADERELEARIRPCELEWSVHRHSLTQRYGFPAPRPCGVTGSRLFGLRVLSSPWSFERTVQGKLNQNDHCRLAIHQEIISRLRYKAPVPNLE